jgi:hypothetical protein
MQDDGRRIVACRIMAELKPRFLDLIDYPHLQVIEDPIETAIETARNSDRNSRFN